MIRKSGTMKWRCAEGRADWLLSGVDFAPTFIAMCSGLSGYVSD
jgi:hypothetical protein